MPTTFSSHPFAEGRFRRAYMGTYTGPPSKMGKKCVVKENKESFTWQATDWSMAVKMQEECSALASKFNQENAGSRVTIKFADVEVERVVSSSRTGEGPKLHEFILVEDHIPGKFTKWCNNYGYISSSSELMPAFMHWSWVHTGGQKMIADLQGVRSRSGYTYTLTDSVLLSNQVDGHQYGCTDTGVEGMAMFFLHHTCSHLCAHCPKPAFRDVLATPDALWQLKAIKAATAYAHELKFPVHVRQKMTTVFPEVAARHV